MSEIAIFQSDKALLISSSAHVVYYKKEKSILRRWKPDFFYAFLFILQEEFILYCLSYDYQWFFQNMPI